MSTAELRDVRKYRKELQKLSDAVLLMLDALDREMRQGITITGHGSRVAKIMNGIDEVNDGVRYFALGVNFRTDDKKKAVAKLIKKLAG